MAMAKQQIVLFENGNANSYVINSYTNELTMQASGTGTATLKAKVSEDMPYAEINCLNTKTYDMGKITTNDIYTVSVENFYAITIEATGFTKIVARSI